MIVSRYSEKLRHYRHYSILVIGVALASWDIGYSSPCVSSSEYRPFVRRMMDQSAVMYLPTTNILFSLSMGEVSATRSVPAAALEPSAPLSTG